MEQKPRVHIIATGGTIAGTAGDASATVGYKAGELTVDQLIGSVPGLKDLAELTGEQLCNIDSKDMQESIWLRLAKHVSEAAARKDVDGIVITHGTDTLEETAFFLQLALNTDKPVVLTGAMRPATAISADGPMNIWQSVRVASDKKATGRGVLVVMNGQIHSATSVTKTDINALEAFRSPGKGPAGVIVSNTVFWHKDNTNVLSCKNKCKFSTEGLSRLPKVRIIYGHVGCDDDLFVRAALTDGAKGLVYAACGNGSVPENLKEIFESVIASGVPVVIATRCGEGIVMLPKPMTKDGFIASGPLNPQKAKILLQLALTKTKDVKEIRKLAESMGVAVL